MRAACPGPSPIVLLPITVPAACPGPSPIVLLPITVRAACPGRRTIVLLPITVLAACPGPSSIVLLPIVLLRITVRAASMAVGLYITSYYLVLMGARLAHARIRTQASRVATSDVIRYTIPYFSRVGPKLPFKQTPFTGAHIPRAQRVYCSSDVLPLTGFEPRPHARLPSSEGIRYATYLIAVAVLTAAVLGALSSSVTTLRPRASS